MSRTVSRKSRPVINRGAKYKPEMVANLCIERLTFDCRSNPTANTPKLMIIEAILFSTFFTAALGYPYWQFTRHREPVYDDHEPSSREIRESPLYRVFRNSVLKRDNFQCIWCHSENNLEVHHLYSFASFPEGRFDIKNAITLCRSCHTQTPNYGSKEKAFSQQIINSR